MVLGRLASNCTKPDEEMKRGVAVWEGLKMVLTDADRRPRIAAPLSYRPVDDAAEPK